MSKPVILTFCNFYLPGYRAGGPIRTISNMVDRLGDRYEFRIVTSDRDFGDTLPYSDIETGVWINVGKAQVMYLSSKKTSVLNLADIVRKVSPRVIYLNSFFDTVFTHRLLWARKLGKIPQISVVIAPRGEFSLGALRLKNKKKKTYILLQKITNIYNDLIWHASSSLERKDILRELTFVKNDQVFEAINLASVATDIIETPIYHVMGDYLRVCFLSRISPKKNLYFALEVLKEVKARVVFTIYGPIEDAYYWAQCEKLISVMPSNVKVVYGGELVPTDVVRIISKEDLFFFPTCGENYGHVIHEALSAGLPVLISDQTPWNEVAELGIGWVFSLNCLHDFTSSIDSYAVIPSERISKIRTQAAEFANERKISTEAVLANIKLFETALHGSS